MTVKRKSWAPIVARAAEIVDMYATGCTLRQLFYRLVAALLLPNTEVAYHSLSHETAKARREGRFPALIDRGRTVQRALTFDGAEDARAWLASRYRRDRTEGQEYTIYIGVEKDTLSALAWAWFSDFGLPIVALRGYASQTLADDVARDVERQGRPAVLLYAGDFDPTGKDIDRDFAQRVGCFDRVVRVALEREQIDKYDLPPQPGKSTDSRAARFMAEHGELIQVELEALPPDTLHDLYLAALKPLWNTFAYEIALQREEQERGELLP